jgi:3-deoxy-D-manno-octulosonic-acid transferase
MKKAVDRIHPKLMILLESAMWPAHLSALKKNGIKTIVINGRMTARSLKRYLLWPTVWYGLRPEKILAISESDADRFARLFGPERVRVMPNIKFDRLDPYASVPDHKNPLRSIILPETKLLVFGSVRQQEEPQVEKIIIEMLGLHPQLVIGLFPRHAERVKTWISILNQHQLPWKLRSKTETAVPAGSVIVWDTFGELANAYKLSGAAFVGGTLRPLGGQNFLEPLTHGVRPVIGPFWENFDWVGSEIVQQGLVKVAADWKEVVKYLDEELTEPHAREDVRDAAQRYMQDRQGGTAMACRLITEFLN